MRNDGFSPIFRFPFNQTETQQRLAEQRASIVKVPEHKWIHTIIAQHNSTSNFGSNKPREENEKKTAYRHLVGNLLYENMINAYLPHDNAHILITH